MLSEEKKAIELLKTYENKLVYEIEDNDKKAVKIILNLIIKLQEENKVFKRALDNETADRSNDLLELQKKDKMIDLIINTVYKRFKTELVLEYGFENEEQFKQCFERRAEDERYKV